MMFDQFTRWLCPNCGEAGIDSWNKAMFDGLNWDHGPLPDRHILGDQCHRCTWNCVTCYTAADVIPHIIMGPDRDSYGFEADACRAFLENVSAGQPLEASDRRDADWSRGCVAAKGQLQ